MQLRPERDGLEVCMADFPFSFIVLLFKRRRPAAIPQFVIAVIIWVTIQRFSVWTLAHVGEEIGEAVLT